jgi:hypothetical protein
MTAIGADHPRNLTLRKELAEAYRNAGRPAEAIPLGQKLVADRERVSGADHPATLAAQNNLALAYWDSDRWTEAIRLSRRTLALSKRALGATHPATELYRKNLKVLTRAYRRRLLVHTLAVVFCGTVSLGWIFAFVQNPAVISTLGFVGLAAIVIRLIILWSLTHYRWQMQFSVTPNR